ncbi:Protein of unknown function [Pyronema omphalodes CBS 100304]|uniref:Uncharacterized protein n=1 Tax=Pyronema omphalodes (strain CBS 100304) TaxID=1076935 RepID=U4LPZ4_PYROM|nr:Protein of unknown function [Pyronema omphalodes CBS 100304]
MIDYYWLPGLALDLVTRKCSIPIAIVIPIYRSEFAVPGDLEGILYTIDPMPEPVTFQMCKYKLDMTIDHNDEQALSINKLRPPILLPLFPLSVLPPLFVYKLHEFLLQANLKPITEYRSSLENSEDKKKEKEKELADI